MFFLGISGNILAATPFWKLGKNFTAWVATPYHEDRKDRIQTFSYPRKILDKSIIKIISSKIERRLLSCGNVLSLSEYTQHKLCNIGASKENTILPRPVHTQNFYPDVSKNKRFLITFSGRLLDPRKNIYFLCKAIEYLNIFDKKFQLQLIGCKQEEVQPLLKTIAQYSANISILPHQPIETLCALLQSTDVFVIPSFQEGLCFAGLEAMACGCPVVSTKCGGPEEYVINDVTGYVVDFDFKALADAIYSICNNREKRNKMSRNCIDLIKDQYNEKRAEKILMNNILQ